MNEPIKDQNLHTADFIPSNAAEFTFLENPVLDNLVSTVLELSAELWSLKRRVLFTESLLDAKGAVTKAEIETYRPSPEEEVEFRDQRDRFIKRIYAPFTRPIPLDKAPTASSFLNRSK